MRLRLTEEVCAALYPTIRPGGSTGRRTHVPLLNRDVAAGEVVEIHDEATAAALVLAALMEPADADTAKQIASALEKKRMEHKAAAEKIRALAEAEENRMLRDDESQRVESCEGYCAAIDSAFARLGAGKKKTEKEKE